MKCIASSVFISIVVVIESSSYIDGKEKQTPDLSEYLTISSLYNPLVIRNLCLTKRVLTRVFFNCLERLLGCFSSSTIGPDKLIIAGAHHA